MSERRVSDGALHLPPVPAALIAPGFEGRFVEVVTGMAQGRALPPRDGRNGRSSYVWIDEISPSDRIYECVNNVAIIQVSGVLLHEFPVIGWPYATGYNCLRLQLARAFNDADVKAIVLWISSGGGEVSGCFDLVDWIAATKAGTKKPIVAICNEFAYSAAYAIASVADSIVAPRTGGIGSIGVVMLHVDYSKMLDDWGLKVTFIHAGKHKVDGNPYQELPDDVRATWQGECEELRQIFAATVVRNRQTAGVSIDIAAVLKTEAKVYASPRALDEAGKIGLVDDVMPPLDALQSVIAQTAAASAA